MYCGYGHFSKVSLTLYSQLQVIPKFSECRHCRWEDKGEGIDICVKLPSHSCKKHLATLDLQVTESTGQEASFMGQLCLSPGLRVFSFHQTICPIQTFAFPQRPSCGFVCICCALCSCVEVRETHITFDCLFQSDAQAFLFLSYISILLKDFLLNETFVNHCIPYPHSNLNTFLLSTSQDSKQHRSCYTL